MLNEHPSAPLLKPSDVQRLLAIGLSTVYRLAADGTLPALKIPGTNVIRFKAERVATLLRQWEQNGRGRRRTTEREAQR